MWAPGSPRHGRRQPVRRSIDREPAAWETGAAGPFLTVGDVSVWARGSGDGGSLGKARERVVHFLLGELGVLEFAGQVGVVGRQVEVAVAAEPEEDHARLARLARRL